MFKVVVVRILLQPRVQIEPFCQLCVWSSSCSYEFEVGRFLEADILLIRQVDLQGFDGGCHVLEIESEDAPMRLAGANDAAINVHLCLITAYLKVLSVLAFEFQHGTIVPLVDVAVQVLDASCHGTACLDIEVAVVLEEQRWVIRHNVPVVECEGALAFVKGDFEGSALHVTSPIDWVPCC